VALGLRGSFFVEGGWLEGCLVFWMLLTCKKRRKRHEKRKTIVSISRKSHENAREKSQKIGRQKEKGLLKRDGKSSIKTEYVAKAKISGTSREIPCCQNKIHHQFLFFRASLKLFKSSKTEITSNISLANSSSENEK